MPWTLRGNMAVTRGNIGPHLPELNGLLWAASGQFGSSAANNRTNTDSYDPATGTWTARAAMPEGIRSFGLAAEGGYLWTFGGLNTLGNAHNKIHRYDPGANTWSVLAGHTTLPFTWFGVSAAPIGDGRIILWGGTEDGGSQKRIQAFDPATLITTSLTNITGGSDADLAWGTSCGGDVLAGILYWAHSDKCIAYDISGNTFATKATPPYIVNASCFVAFGGMMTLLGGGTTSSTRVLHYVFDTLTNTWTSKTSIPTQRSLAAAGVASAIGLIIAGGQNNGSSTTWLNTTYEWAPPIVDLPAVDLTVAFEVTLFAELVDADLTTEFTVDADTDKKYGRVPVVGMASGRVAPSLPVDDIFSDAFIWNAELDYWPSEANYPSEYNFPGGP